MKVLISEKLSPHRYKTPEGYLICTDAILARTGKQTYRRSEVFNDDDDTEIEIDRPAEEVFSASTLASFENKPIVVEHPDEDVNAENHNKYAVGFARDIRRGVVDGQDVMLATIVITDAQTIEEIENGEHTDLSCGYDCDINDDEHPCQRNIRGNHIALCQHGRAGIARLVDSIKDARYAILHPKKWLFLTVGGKSWSTESDNTVKTFASSKEAEDYARQYCDDFKIARLNDASHDSIKDATFEVWYVDRHDNKQQTFVIAADQKEARQKVQKIYGPYRIYEVRKVKDGVKDMKVSHDNIREQPIYVMQSNVDKNLFFYIGKTHAMKEGEFTYAQYDMEGMTPDELRKELEANGWHKVSKGPAPFIDEDPYEESTEELEEAEKNLHDEMICNTETDCKDELQTFRIGFGSGGRYDDEPGLDISVDVKATDVKSAIEKAKQWAKTHNYDDAWSFREVKTKGDRHFQIDACKDAQMSNLGDKVRFRNRAYVVIKVQKGKSDDVARLTLRPLERFDEKDKPFEGGGDAYWDIRVERWQLDDSIKDAKTEYVFNYRDTYHGTNDKMRVDAKNLDEAIRKFGDTMALGGFGTANIYVVSVSPNDGYMRAYGKLSEMLKQKWTRDSVKDATYKVEYISSGAEMYPIVEVDATSESEAIETVRKKDKKFVRLISVKKKDSVKKLDSKKLLSIVRATKSIKK